jgi:hypothetical protein
VKLSISAAILTATLLLVPIAHAQTGTMPIGDPEADTIQLWSSLAWSIEVVAHEAMSTAEQFASSVQTLAAAVVIPHAPQTLNGTYSARAPAATAQPASLATGVASFENPEENSTTIASSPPNAEIANAPAPQPIVERFTENEPLASEDTVTQEQLTSQLQQLSNALTSKLNSSSVLTVPAWAPSQAIDQLDNVTITNANLTASEIPSLDYLSLSGGTLSGALSVPTLSASSTNYGILSATSASTSNLSNFGTAYFGSTATSTFDSAGDLTVAGNTTLENATSTTLFSTIASSTNLFAQAASLGTLSAGTLSLTSTLSVPDASLTNATTTSFSVTGTTALNRLVLSGNILSTLNTSAPPSSLGNWNSIGTAFTGDLSHMGLGISRQTTGTSLGQPTSGYALTPELSGIASYDYNSAGWNQSTSSNNGRTGALNFYAKNDNYGEGDSTSYFCNGFVGSTLTGATSFLASPEVGCIGGQLFAGANGALLEGVGDINFKDQGHDAAVVGLNFNFTRTNATGNLNANWGAWTFQNQGALPLDWMVRASGPVRTGLDLSDVTYPDYTLVGISLNSGGIGYSVGDSLSPPDGTYDQPTVIKVLAVNGSGTIQTFGLDRAGLYSATPTSPSNVSGGTGTGASFIVQYSTGGSPALVTQANNCWYGNATQDTSVYNTAYSSTLKLGTSWVCWSSSLGAWNFVSGNNSVLQLYNNQVIANTNFKVTGSVGIGTTSPATNFAVNGSGYLTGGFGVGLLNTATGTLQTTGTTTIGGLSTLQGGFVSDASSTIVGNFTSTGSGTFGGTLALNGTTGTTTLASGQGFTIGGSQFIIQQGSGNVGVGTTSPYAQLSIATPNGATGGVGTLFVIASSTASGTTTLLSVSNTGAVGIGQNYVAGVGLTVRALQTNLNALAVNNASGNPIINEFVDGSSNGWITVENASGVIQDKLAAAGSGQVSYVNATNNAKFAIGTSTGYSALTIWGSDTASSTPAFNVVNNGSTTVFSVFDGGNAELSGSLSQNSDQRLKTNIQSLGASSSLAAIDSLNPVTFNWADPDKGATPQLGFIAQQVLPIFPNLISTTSATALTPDGTLSLNYIGLISPIVAAIQALSSEITSIESTIAGFADSFTTQNLTFTRTLCAEESNGAQICITGDQLAALVAQAGQGSGNPSADAGTTSDSSSPPPQIQINGENPAFVPVGDTYNDLGTTIIGPQADLNLGITTYVNGVETSPVQIDTSAAATDTIDYVATDQNGLTSTSTRTVFIEAPSIVPTQDASTTDATTPDQ